MTPEVEQAVEELRARFPDTEVDAVGTGDGGAIVTIARVDPGPTYVQRETWMRFAISFQYPYADIYPLFVRSDLDRVDGQASRGRHRRVRVHRREGPSTVQAEQPSQFGN